MDNKLLAGLGGAAAAAVFAFSTVAAQAAPGVAAEPKIAAGHIVTVDSRGGVDVDVELGSDGRYEDDYYDRTHGPDYYRERGYRSYDRRPDDWRNRGCVGVGPVHFCK